MKPRAAAVLLVALLPLLALVLLLAPTEAQQIGRTPSIGWLSMANLPTANRRHIYLETFHQGLKDLGWVEGRNIIVEYRGAAGDASRLHRLAEELVSLKVDVIVATTNACTIAAAKATKTIPIVQATGLDPVALGLAKSLARPDGNVTGVNTAIGPEISAKRFQLIREVVPGLSRLALLRWPDDPGGLAAWHSLEDAARQANVRLRWFEFRPGGDLEGMIALVKQEGHDALYVSGDGLLFQHRRLIVELAARHRIPTTYGVKDYVVDEGGLMSYGASLADLFRRAAWYVDRILKGTNPADLPIEQPTKFELVINLRTAKALGLTIPPALLLRADQVIE